MSVNAVMADDTANIVSYRDDSKLWKSTGSIFFYTKSMGNSNWQITHMTSTSGSTQAQDYTVRVHDSSCANSLASYSFSGLTIAATGYIEFDIDGSYTPYNMSPETVYCIEYDKTNTDSNSIAYSQNTYNNTNTTIYNSNGISVWNDGTLDSPATYDARVGLSGANFLITANDESKPPAIPQIELTALDNYTGATITNFNANLTNSSGTYSLSTTNGSIFSPENGVINVTFYSNLYHKSINTSWDSTNDLEGSMGQTIIKLEMKDIINNTVSFYEWNLTDNTNSKTFTTYNGSFHISPPSNTALNFTFAANTSAFYYEENTYTFNTLDTGYYNATVSYKPIVLKFKDAAEGTPLNNANITVYYPNSAPEIKTTNSSGHISIDIINGNNLDLGDYTFTFNSYAGYQSPVNFSRTINNTNIPYYEEIGITAVGITVNVYDRETKTLLTGIPVDVIILGILNKTTTTGTINVIDDTFIAGEYTIQTYADGYITEQQLITFTGQANATLDVYMLNSTGTNTALMFANVIDEFYRVQQDARVSLLEYDPSVKAFTKVSEKLTNVNGEAVFAIELNVKSYYMMATKTIGGQTYSAETNSEIFQTENEIRNIVMRFTDPFEAGITDYLLIDYNETFINNISTIDFTYTTLDNFIAEVCVEYFQSLNNYDTSIYTKCVNSSAAYSAVPVLLNRSNNYFAEIYQKYNGNKYLIDRWVYPSQYNFDSLLSYNQYASGFFVLLWVLLLSISLMSKNIPLFCFGGMILTWIQFFKFPSVAMGSGSAVKTIMLIFILNLSRKKEDYT